MPEKGRGEKEKKRKKYGKRKKNEIEKKGGEIQRVEKKELAWGKKEREADVTGDKK